MAAMCAMFVASCSDEGGLSGSGALNPLSECVLQESVVAGGEAVVQWNGFTEESDILLVGTDGKEHAAAVQVVTASGLVFDVPKDLPAGTYAVVLVSPGERLELGTMEVLEAQMPVSGLKMPSASKPGEMVVIEGIGFEEGCKVRLIGADGQEYVIDADLAYAGISVLLPDEIVEGDYEAYLVQDGFTWLLSSSLTIYAEIKEKLLQRIDYYSPYIGSALIRLSWEISHEEPVTLTVSEYLVDGETESLEAYDTYVCTKEGYFELTYDGFEASNDMAMQYILDSEDAVTQSDVLIYGNDVPTSFVWSYDTDGYLTDISSPKRSFRSLAYEDGNLTLFRNTSFEYSDSGLAASPVAPDVVWAYMSLMEKNDPFVYFPYLLGWYKKASALLPTRMMKPSPTGTGTTECALSYDFDEDSYVTRMFWTEGTSSCRVEFIYSD